MPLRLTDLQTSEWPSAPTLSTLGGQWVWRTGATGSDLHLGRITLDTVLETNFHEDGIKKQESGVVLWNEYVCVPPKFKC